jgi:hypothetical protein
MQTKVEDVKYMRDDEGFWLRIKLPHDAIPQTMNWIAGRNPSKSYDLELKEHRERRSLDANAYCWVLIGKLAAKIGQNKSDVYREYIKEIGDNYTVSCFQKEAVSDMKRLWENDHLGRIAEEFQSKVDGCTNLRLYYGSSDFDTKQMSRLIDAIIADCKENGIETATPEELARLKEEWR